jgi:hypothetical protein
VFDKEKQLPPGASIHQAPLDELIEGRFSRQHKRTSSFNPVAGAFSVNL